MLCSLAEILDLRDGILWTGSRGEQMIKWNRQDPFLLLVGKVIIDPAFIFYALPTFIHSASPARKIHFRRWSARNYHVITMKAFAISLHGWKSVNRLIGTSVTYIGRVFLRQILERGKANVLLFCGYYRHVPVCFDVRVFLLAWLERGSGTTIFELCFVKMYFNLKTFSKTCRFDRATFRHPS